MKLIDTSSWIHQLRQRGDPIVRARVEALLAEGRAAWCAPVRLELWAGVGRPPEARVLREYAAVLPDYPINREIWSMAEQLAERGRKQGLRAPPTDILIAACARHHRLELEHADAHFDWLLVV